MSLDFHLIPIAFKGGIETKQDEKLVIPGKLLRLENGVLTKGGIDEFGNLRVAFKKRNGYAKLGKTVVGASDISGGEALNVFQDELLLFNQGLLYSYATGIQAWKGKGTIVPVSTSVTPIVKNARDQTQPDSAIISNTAGGVIVYTWNDSSGGIRATVVDEVSGNPYQSDALVSASGVFAKCIAIGGNIFVVYVDGVNYKQRRLNPATPSSFDSEVTIAADVHAVIKFHDIVEYNTDRAVFAYRNTGGDTKLAYLASTGLQGTTVTGFPNAITVPEAPEDAISIAVNPSTFDIYVAYYNSTTGTRCFGRTNGFIANFAPVTIDATTTPATRNISMIYLTSSTMKIFYEVTAAATYNHFIKTATITSTGTVSGVSVIARSIGMASKAFYSGTTIYLNTVHESVFQATYFLMRSDGVIVSKNLYGEAGGNTVGPHLAQVRTLSSGLMYYPVLRKAGLRSDQGNVFTLRGVSRIDLTFSGTNKYYAGELGKNLHVAGGFLSDYDGQNAVEHNFHLFPEDITSTPQVGGGTVANGSYEYKFIYAWVDAKGQIHRSAPSTAINVTVSGANNQVLFVVPTLRLTGKDPVNGRSLLTIEGYRTVAGDNQVFYRFTSIASPTFNTMSADTVSVTDILSDATLRTGEILYTVGGVLENFGPGSTSLVASSKNRVFVIDEEGNVNFSRQFVEGESVNFAQELLKRVPAIGGMPTGIATMDDKVVIFKKSRSYYFYGDGPNDTGEQDTFSDVLELNTDVGCVDPNSIAITPQGIVYRSEKGIRRLSRNLETEYIGAPVEGFNGLTVTSSDVVPELNQIRFVTSDDKALVFDYHFQQWVTFKNHGGLDAVVWQGSYVYLRKTGGDVYQEVDGLYSDDNTSFSMLIETAWIKLAGLQGYQRVQRAVFLGDYISSHKMRLSVGYDYLPEYTSEDEYLFDVATELSSTDYGDDPTYGDSDVYGGQSDKQYQFEAHLVNQKCQAVRFKFEDIINDVYGASYSLTELALMVGLKKGTNKFRRSRSE